MQYSPMVLVSLALVPAAQSTRYVDDDACPNPGSGTPTDPYCSVQTAIGASSAGDVVIVLPGTYAEDLNFNGRDVIVRSSGGPAATVLAKGSAGIAPTVEFSTGETNAATLEGFTIQGSPTSSAISCNGASPTLLGNVIENGWNSLGGGGVRITGGSTAVLIGNEIRNNRSDNRGAIGVGRGGGIFIEGSSPRIEDNWIRDNLASGALAGHGGGVSVTDSTLTFNGNTVSGNQGGKHGGGIHALRTSLSMQGNLVYSNRVNEYNFEAWGGGLYAIKSDLTLGGNTFTQNQAYGFTIFTGGAAIALVETTGQIRDHIVWNNTTPIGLSEISNSTPLTGPQITYSIVRGRFPGTGNLSADPLFVDPANRDYSLQAGSPAIDAGDPMTPASGTDFELDPRVLDGDGDGFQRVDMGWDEYNPTSLSATGAPVTGGTVTFTTSAPAGQGYLLAYSLGRFDFALPPYGSLLIEPSGLTLIGAGATPGIDAIGIPPSPTLVGTVVLAQALAGNGATPPGSFSRRVELTLR